MIPGLHLMFVAVHNEKHLVGGTEIGRKFLRESGSHVPYSFLGYLSTTQTGTTYLYMYDDIKCFLCNVDSLLLGYNNLSY